MFLIQILISTFKNFIANRDHVHAAYIALSSLLALFPFIFFVTQIALFVQADILTENLDKVIEAVLPKTLRAPVLAELNTVLNSISGQQATISIFLAFYLASNSIEATCDAFNHTYNQTDTRHFLLRRFLNLFFVGLAFVGFVLLTLAFMIGPFIWDTLKDYVQYAQETKAFITLSQNILVFVIILSIVSILHLKLPTGKRTLLYIFPGTLFTVIAWAISAYLTAFYLKEIANYSATYAGLATAMALNLYIYILALIALFGAELNVAIDAYMKQRQQLTLTPK